MDFVSVLSFLLWILVKIPMSFSNYMAFSIDMFTPHTLHALLLLRTDAPMWMTSVAGIPSGFQIISVNEKSQ